MYLTNFLVGAILSAMTTTQGERMRKLIVSEFVTLDGVMEDPGGAEGFDRGGWAFKFERGPDGDAFKAEEVFGSDALLLGRRTYEGFAAAWPERTDDAGFADRMNSMAKYVVSGTLEGADWNNTTLIDGDLADGVRALKSQQGGDILVAGSGRLVAGLMEHDLVDEYRLMVFPTILGRGQRLFPESEASADLELVDSRPSADVTLMILRPKRG
jgi:dihydrofolate reductase